MARIIFDLDGTLVDSVPSLAAAANAVLRRLGRAPASREMCARHVGHGVAALVEGLLTATGGVPADGLAPHLALFREIYEADPVTGSAAYAGVTDALAAFSLAGHGLGVCTQKPVGAARMLLEGLNLMPPITALTGGGSLDVLKPDPRMLAHCGGQLPPGRMIYVGDSETDAATACAAGVPFILFTRGYRRRPVRQIAHAAVFDEFARLPGQVAEILGAAVP